MFKKYNANKKTHEEKENMVATDQAEKNFLTFYQHFPDFSKSNS